MTTPPAQGVQHSVTTPDGTHRVDKIQWYAHRRLRRACFRFVLLNHEGSLFAFCDPELAESGRVASTTNQLEDGVNAEIKRVPDAHRGLGEEHMRRRCEWVVYMRSANPDPEAFAAPDCRRPLCLFNGIVAGRASCFSPLERWFLVHFAEIVAEATPVRQGPAIFPS